MFITNDIAILSPYFYWLFSMLTRMAQKLAMVGLIDMASSGGQNPHHDSYQNPSKPTCSSWNPHHLGLLVTKIPKKTLKNMAELNLRGAELDAAMLETIKDALQAEIPKG